jgi:hypothetical protein
MRRLCCSAAFMLFAGCSRPEGSCSEQTFWLDSDGDAYGDATQSIRACAPRSGLADNDSDCDDSNPDVHPGATEVCNGLDDDCDTSSLEGQTWYDDLDGDGYGAAESKLTACDPPDGFVSDGTDCDDSNPDVSPAATESCATAYDDDCDGASPVDIDADSDGDPSLDCPGGGDCNDADPNVHSGAVDTCGDGVDQDCLGGDHACSFAGEYDLVDADAEAIADGALDVKAGGQLAAGDVTGDDVDDIIVGATSANAGKGGGYVVSGAVKGEVLLDDVGFPIASDETTWGAPSSIGIGDLNGDGIEDLALGAPVATRGGQFVAFGPVTGDVTPADYDASLTTGTLYSNCGGGGDLGDLNGDGIDDAAIGAYQDGSIAYASGKAYVEFGPLTGSIDLDEEADVTIDSAREMGFAGYVVKAGRDVDGDGIGDLLASAPYDNTGAHQAGATYVLYGPVALDSFEDATILMGPGTNAFAGNYITFGDYDGDGLADVVTSISSPASVAIVRGPISDASVSLGEADTILESSGGGQTFGWGLATGDLDGDETDELLIGDPNTTVGGLNSGVSYLVVDPPTGSSSITAVAQAVFLGNDAGGLTGAAVAIADIDGSGFGEVIIGAPGLSGVGGIYVVYAD